MSNVGRDSVDHAVNLILLLAEQECPADKRVAQIVNTWMRMTAAGRPTQTASQALERAIHGSLRKRAPFGCKEDRFNAGLAWC